MNPSHISRQISLTLVLLSGLFHPAEVIPQGMDAFRFDRIRVEDGLHNGIVYQVIRDGNGLMWFGLHDGIDRYNGYDFKHFDLAGPGDLFTYTNTQVRSVFQLSENEFWISSGNDIFRYDLKQDKFHVIIRDLSSDQEVNQIQDLHITEDSICYIATNQGMFAYGIPSDTLYDYSPRSMSAISIHPMGNVLWIGTAGGMRVFDPAVQDYVPYHENPAIEEFFGSVIALSYCTDTLREITFIGTRRSGLHSFDHRTQTLAEIRVPGIEFTHIRSIRRYRDHYLIGMDGNGLCILDPDWNLVAHYVHDEDDDQSLSSDAVYDVYVDPRERIWLSSYGGGVSVYDPNKKAFHVYKHESNNRNSLRNNVSRSFLELDDRMVFGTAKGLSMVDHAGNWRHVPGLASGRAPDIVLDMCRDSQGNIWLGTFGNGVEVRDPGGNVIDRFTTAWNGEQGFSTDYIYTLFEDSRNRIWMGGIRGGLMVHDPGTGGFRVFNTLQNIHDIIESSGNRIVIGTLDGVRIMEYHQGEYRLAEDQDTILTRIRTRVFCLHESRPGEFWVGTEGSGLIHYDRLSGEVTYFNEKSGLPSDIVYGILEDDQRKIWLSTTAGLAVYDRETQQFNVFTEADGISGRDFNYGAFYKAADGTMYFGSHTGITYFKPEEIILDRGSPEIILTNIDILGTDAEDPENPVYDLNINETDRLSLRHNQNSFSIEFAAISYTSSEKNQYRWAISGGEFGDGNWSTPSRERRAVFSYLPPGNYEFRVTGSNSDGYWNTQGKALQISIAPPFWNTIAARILYLIIIIFLFIALQRFIITGIKEKQAKEKIEFFINIAHDIRTPLTLIAAPMSRLVKSSKLNWEEKEEVRVAVKNSERLKSLLNQLLEFQKASLNKQALRVAEGDVAKLLNDVVNNFQPLADERMINTRLTIPEDPMPAWMDRQKIEKILYNLVSNAIKYSYKGGVVEVMAENAEGRIIIRVMDEGRGIPVRQQKEIFKRYFRAQNTVNSRETGSGVGLMLSKKLIELHRGNIRFTSAENAGSEFVIDFPANRSAYQDIEIRSADQVNKEMPPEAALDELKFSRKYTVLVVEDNKELRNHIKNDLSDQYNVLTARNGKLAFEMILKLDIDLVVSDIMMPEMDGRELCQKVRTNIATNHIPIILLTALNTMQDKMDGLEHGADVYIEKPFDMEHLRIRIANLLKTRERLMQRFLDQPDHTDDRDIPNKPDQELMRKLKEVVSEEALREDFSVKDMCRMVGMSRPVLYRKLKAYTGHSPQDYLIILRLNHATKLMKEGRFSIKEVAYESGFSDPKYFSKSFKKHYGSSPSEYIKGNGQVSGT